MNKRYLKWKEIYKRFTQGYNQKSLDFSNKAFKEMYLYESEGVGELNIHDMHSEYLKTGQKINGFLVGKRNLDITVKMWLHTVKNPGWYYTLKSLYNDWFPKWFLTKVFANFLKYKKEFYLEKNTEFPELEFMNE